MGELALLPFGLLAANMFGNMFGLFELDSEVLVVPEDVGG